MISLDLTNSSEVRIVGDRSNSIVYTNSTKYYTKILKVIIYFINFLACQCVMDGSLSMECDAVNGECTCLNSKIEGHNCEKCGPERYGYPDCHRKY